MYYAERIISVFVYGIILLIFSFLLKNNKKSNKKILKIYTLILTLLAFLYIPNPGYDLERIFFRLNNSYYPMQFSQLIKKLESSFTPTIEIFYYSISKTKINGLVPATAAFLFYSAVFNIYNNVCENNDLSGIKKAIFMIFIMSMGTFLEVISNIRCMTAFSLIVYCFYSEVFKQKKIINHIPIYFVASTIHLAALAVTIIRFALYPLQQKKFNPLYIIIPLGLFYVLYTFYPEFINQIIFTNSYYKEFVTYTYMPELIIMIIMTTYIFLIKLIHWKWINDDKKLKSVNLFSILVLGIMIINYNDYSMFHRFGTLHFLINIPIMGKYLSHLKMKSGIELMLIISAIVLLIAGTLGNLSGFKFF